MEETKLIKALNMLAARSVFLESQIFAIRRMLDKKGVVTDAEFDLAARVALEAYREYLAAPQTEADTLEAWLQKFQGPIQ
jgi:hypothetical protein